VIVVQKYQQGVRLLWPVILGQRERVVPLTHSTMTFKARWSLLELTLPLFVTDWFCRRRLLGHN